MVRVNTDLTEMLGIEYPIVSAAMGPGGQQQLVTAVSEAGGLGILSSPDEASPREARGALKEFFDYVTTNTDAKFGVNVTVGTAEADVGGVQEVQEALIEEILVSKLSDNRVNEQLALLETSAGSPEPFIDDINDVKEDTDLLHFQKCASARHARKAEAMGVDGITASGYEMAGHTHKEEDAAHTFVLLPSVVEAVDIPVIASGGVRNGHGLLGALSLGAEGVYMGTRLIATQEADFDSAYKDHIVESKPGADTTIEGVYGPLRVVESPGIEKLKDEKEGMDPFEVAVRKNEMIVNAMQGNVEDGLTVAGQVSGYIDDKPSVEELFEDMVSTAKKRHEELDISS
jgi:enoyl-[acyl-carrier protein] reductase II